MVVSPKDYNQCIHFICSMNMVRFEKTRLPHAIKDLNLTIH